MANPNQDLNYVKRILQAAENGNSYPSIYALWGVLVLVGYTIAEFRLEWINIYWLAAAPLGFALSAWLGIRHDKAQGLENRRQGNLYMQHFAILGAAVFVAIFTAQHQAILLLLGLGYCLAGLYLDRIMLWFGGLALLAHVGVHTNLISSNLWLGVILSAGLFVSAISAARGDSHQPSA